ncbi:hypothetical protein PROAA_540011 [Candidatus Propionivibrio aalborgensis]|uniref:Uncharacterized protein n=1 Tax=Candidatus Propionivibrio aalborgensis TaxID=1860101 RepID=A0A1A8Y039_9RHOO|nr:hypothetical protein [Candidatus Propionivibrio aalborgensis]SBT10549.1 hypothetical protein PROAA_540011 [Candidatus Propionivibrio aalborgensis]
MSTLFKLIVLYGTSLDIDVALFQQALPKDMHVATQEDGTYITVASVNEEDGTAQYRVDRELDRLYFLTNCRIRAEMCRRTVTASFTARYSICYALPKTIEPLAWSYELALQLRLWAIAVPRDDPFVKILLLFQIIELSYPSKNDYPLYVDHTTPPHPRTECKLLRHLVAHSGDVGSTDLKNYCSYLALPALMLDRTDPHYVAVLTNKASFVELEARKVLASAL